MINYNYSTDPDIEELMESYEYDDNYETLDEGDWSSDDSDDDFEDDSDDIDGFDEDCIDDYEGQDKIDPMTIPHNDAEEDQWSGNPSYRKGVDDIMRDNSGTEDVEMESYFDDDFDEDLY